CRGASSPGGLVVRNPLAEDSLLDRPAQRPRRNSERCVVRADRAQSNRRSETEVAVDKAGRRHELMDFAGGDQECCLVERTIVIAWEHHQPKPLVDEKGGCP